jgi:hypothetical protein
MAFGFANCLPETLTWHGSAERLRPIGAGAVLADQRIAATNLWAGGVNGLATGFRVPFALKIGKTLRKGGWAADGEAGGGSPGAPVGCGGG